MNQIGGEVNTIAPLANVALCCRALERAMNRPAHLPGMVCFFAPSGWGKSFSATYAANKYRAYYVECKSSWTKKAVLEAILKEMGQAPASTLYRMTDQISEQLALSGRPLIVDEMDHIVDKSAVEIIRDLYEGSGAAILLIGEERLPGKLKKWERFHGRILDFIPAQPADLDDTAHLARLYSPEVAVADDLLRHIHAQSRGSVRRICVNLEKVREEAASLGLARITLADWGKREMYTGEAPARRV